MQRCFSGFGDVFMFQCLLMHVNKGYVWPEDLGQRILSALRSAIRDKVNLAVVVLFLSAIFFTAAMPLKNSHFCLQFQKNKNKLHLNSCFLSSVTCVGKSTFGYTSHFFKPAYFKTNF